MKKQRMRKTIMTKNKYTKIVTPIGVAQYPWLSSPDTKFSEIGDYKTNLILSKKDAQEVIKMIDTAREESTKNAVEQSKGKKVKVADAPYYCLLYTSPSPRD